MEGLFLTSALDDSSLALPAEPARRSAGKVGPKERSVRVQQQVQLTMARRARRSAANGKVALFNGPPLSQSRIYRKYEAVNWNMKTQAAKNKSVMETRDPDLLRAAG